MANSDGQQPWLSYDCTQGVCKPFCPQWCFSIFPPPPPLGFSDDSSGPSLSPLVIALIGILASAFLLVTYYVLISRYCGGFDSLRRRMGGGGGGRHDGAGATAGAAEGSGRFRGDQWQAPPPAGGLEEWVIRSIAVCRYKRGDGLVEGTDCSVCLCEFRDGESLRLLPDCCHAFHLPCIDTWLKSHSNCPLCRANIVYTFTSPSPSPPPRPPPPPPPPPLPPRATTAPPSPPPLPESRHHAALAHDAERGGEREERRGVEGGGVSARKDQPFRIPRDSGVPDGSRHGIVELTEEGLPPAGRSLEGRVSPANTLRAGSEGGDFPVEEVGSSRGFMAEQHACKVGNGIRVLHCVVNPVPTRPFVGGRFCFTGQGKGGSHGSILPL